MQYTTSIILSVFTVATSAFPTFQSDTIRSRDSTFPQLRVRQFDPSSTTNGTFPPSLTGAPSPTGTGSQVLESCGDVGYLPSMYTCYEGDLLCPVINGVPTLNCGSDIATFACYLESEYSCANGQLIQNSVSGSISGTGSGSSSGPNSGSGIFSGGAGSGTGSGSGSPIGTGVPVPLSTGTAPAPFANGTAPIGTGTTATRPLPTGFARRMRY